MDDCLISTETYEEHLEDVSTAFERLKRSNIQLMAYTCHFGFQEVNFLAHRINGVRSSWSRLGSYSYLPAQLCTRVLVEFKLLPYLPPKNKSHTCSQADRKGAHWNRINECEELLMNCVLSCLMYCNTSLPDWN